MTARAAQGKFTRTQPTKLEQVLGVLAECQAMLADMRREVNDIARGKLPPALKVSPPRSEDTCSFDDEAEGDE